MNELKQNFSKSWHDMQTTSAWVQTAQIPCDVLCSMLWVLPWWALVWNVSIGIPAKRGRWQEQILQASQTKETWKKPSTAATCFATVSHLTLAKSQQLKLSWNWEGHLHVPWHVPTESLLRWERILLYLSVLYILNFQDRQHKRKTTEILATIKKNSTIIWILKNNWQNQLIYDHWIPGFVCPKETTKKVLG